MSSQEELAMLTDAERIPQEQRMENAAAQIYAIQKGLEQGKRRGKRLFVAKSTMVVLVAAVMGIGLLFFNPSQFLPQQAAPSVTVTDWEVLESFKKLTAIDIDGLTIESAIRNDYMQIVNKSAEQDGYKVTVNAVTADENRLILLYTVSTTNGQEVYSVSSTKLTDAVTGRNLDSGENGSGSMGAHSEGTLYEWLGKRVMAIDRNSPFPNQIIADFTIASVDTGRLGAPNRGDISAADINYSKHLKVNFTIDPKFWEQKTETVVLNYPFTIDGNQVTISEVELSPLIIIVKYTFPEETKNDWELRNSLFTKVTDGKLYSYSDYEKVELTSNSAHGTEDGVVRYFSSNILDHPTSIRLMLDGVSDREEDTFIEITNSRTRK
jgi:hypothetical protein